MPPPDYGVIKERRRYIMATASRGVAQKCLEKTTWEPNSWATLLPKVGDPGSSVEATDSPVNRKTQSKYPSGVRLQYTCVCFQNRSKELILNPKVGDPGGVHPNGTLSIGSGPGVTVREANREPAWPEGSLWV
jgi:hypothetical protein